MIVALQAKMERIICFIHVALFLFHGIEKRGTFGSILQVFIEKCLYIAFTLQEMNYEVKKV